LRLFPQSRIVNGHETGVNEYPMMAALVNLRRRDVLCGATVISSRYCLTAAHCLVNRNTAYTAILVGDHDITSGTLTLHLSSHEAATRRNGN
jgi:trypsin